MACYQICSLFFAYVHHFWQTNGEQLDVHKSPKMSIEISTKVSRNGQKKWYYYEWGKGSGVRAVLHACCAQLPHHCQNAPSLFQQ
jgi:hypothetical protein